MFWIYLDRLDSRRRDTPREGDTAAAARDRAVLIARAMGVSFAHLGRALGISRERARQIERRALRFMLPPWLRARHDMAWWDGTMRSLAVGPPAAAS